MRAALLCPRVGLGWRFGWVVAVMMGAVGPFECVIPGFSPLLFLRGRGRILCFLRLSLILVEGLLSSVGWMGGIF